MSDESFIIVFDRSSAAGLILAHLIIKEHTSQWWHQMDQTWIVKGHTAREWRNWLKPTIAASSGASVLVLKLPSIGTKRGWSFWGQKAVERCSWIHKEYSGTTHEPEV